jgi:hypothetical protein
MPEADLAEAAVTQSTDHHLSLLFGLSTIQSVITASKLF